MNVQGHDVPEAARAAWLRLRDELLAILGDELVAMWAHGGTLASSQPRQADLDTYVVLARSPDVSSAEDIQHAHDSIQADRGVDWDSWYITVDQAGRAEEPTHAFRDGRRDTSWAIHRAHWLAGRVWVIHGREPADLVVPPSWAEIEAELDRELEHLEAHVAEGDTDPYEATYAVLNGSRILYALGTRDVAISKREAGIWALEHLPDRWHPILRAAVANYDGEATRDDEACLATEMAPFVGMVRQRLPAAGSPSDGRSPRFSGY